MAKSAMPIAAVNLRIAEFSSATNKIGVFVYFIAIPDWSFPSHTAPRKSHPLESLYAQRYLHLPLRRGGRPGWGQLRSAATRYRVFSRYLLASPVFLRPRPVLC